MTIETTQMISEEISTQLSRKLTECRSSLNSQIQDAIPTALAETVLPCIQSTLSTQGRGNFTVVDQRSSGLKGSLGATNSKKTWENHPKTGFTQVSRENSVDSYSREQNRDTSTFP